MEFCLTMAPKYVVQKFLLIVSEFDNWSHCSFIDVGVTAHGAPLMFMAITFDINRHAILINGSVTMHHVSVMLTKSRSDKKYNGLIY